MVSENEIQVISQRIEKCYNGLDENKRKQFCDDLLWVLEKMKANLLGLESFKPQAPGTMSNLEGKVERCKVCGNVL